MTVRVPSGCAHAYREYACKVTAFSVNTSTACVKMMVVMRLQYSESDGCTGLGIGKRMVVVAEIVAAKGGDGV